MNKWRVWPEQNYGGGWLAIAGSVLFITSCAVGPNYHPTQTRLPETWTGVPGGNYRSVKSNMPDATQLGRWWQNFHDPELTSLIERALKANLDVKFAEAGLRQARASRGIIAGGLWPGVTASGGYDRGGTGNASANSFQDGFDAVWEVDIFGGIRRNLESANASFRAAKENLSNVQVTLASEVAINYIFLRSYQEQIEIAEENLSADEHVASLTRQRLSAGFANALDTANAQAEVATTASQIPVLQTALRQSIYAISVLLACPPGALVSELSQPGAVPPTPPEVPVGLPSDLLRRRPDVRAAEEQLHAATAQIGVAVSDFFPKFSLTGTVSNQNDLLRTLFATGSRAWSAGPQIIWPIFQGGSIASNVELQKTLRDQAYITYQKTVLLALQDVENALVALDEERRHHTELNEAYDQNRRALDLSRELYTQGATDFLSVLVAERSLYSSQSALAQSRQAISTDLVSLYKALGGGWDADSEAGRF